MMVFGRPCIWALKYFAMPQLNHRKRWKIAGNHWMQWNDCTLSIQLKDFLQDLLKEGDMKLLMYATEIKTNPDRTPKMQAMPLCNLPMKFGDMQMILNGIGNPLPAAMKLSVTCLCLVLLPN